MKSKIATITCDHRGCDEELELDLDDGSPFEDDDTKIDNYLEKEGWNQSYRGYFCKEHKKDAEVNP